MILQKAAKLVALAGFFLAQHAGPDLVLHNGKIITVDEQFAIAQAVAMEGDRIIAVGADSDVLHLAGSGTRRIDLGGRSVIPGLIDNHMHLLRAGTTWRREVRWDGISTRREALEILRTRASRSSAGEWIYTLGGWTLDQFSDDKRSFSRDELDRIIPDHPVLLQASYYEAYLNSRGLQSLGIEKEGTGEAWVERDASGRATGRIEEAGVRVLAARLPALPQNEVEAGTLEMIEGLNRAGLTSFGSVGCEPAVLPLYRSLADRGKLNVRVFCIDGVGTGTTSEQVSRALPRIAGIKLFQGDNFIDGIFFGESVYMPLHDPMFLVRSDPQPDQLDEWRRIATEIARSRLPLHVHAELEDTIGAFLDQIETINEQYPIKNLRWVFAHVNRINAAHLERMKRLGMYVAVHPWAVINGGINHRLFGDSAYDMPPLKTIQDSGILWGLGSDGTRANQILPFTTLWFAVTGKMVGGTRVLRQTISREDALIAHTRKNAYLVFQENNLGSIQPGKLADLLVLDRDYLTVPADEIKDIKPLITIVGGRIVRDELAPIGEGR